MSCGLPTSRNYKTTKEEKTKPKLNPRKAETKEVA